MYLSEIADIKSVRRIDITALERFFTPHLKYLIKIIEYYQFSVRIVGGAVRNLLLGLPPRDIDLLTDATPDELLYIFAKHNLKSSTRGVKHGTIKVKFPDDEEYEITSIAFAIDQDCCPPHLSVKTGGTWEEDAKRRDVTFNAMSIDMDGRLYDYLNGYNDLRKSYVNFISNPEEQINKDPIVILRFFHCLSFFKNPKFDKSVIPILKEKMKLIKKIKPDRLEKEIGNIKRGQNAEKVLKMMKNLNFDDVVSIKENSVQDHNRFQAYLDSGRIPNRLILRGLAAEARKAGTFEQFQSDYIGQIKHGLYWHWTDSPNFQIDPNTGPRDMSSIGAGEVTPGTLMITSHLQYWSNYGKGGKGRPYVALIDMSAVPRDAYRQVSRGFGNEFFVKDPSAAKVLKVLTKQQAYQLDHSQHQWLPQNFRQLEQFYQIVTNQGNPAEL